MSQRQHAAKATPDQQSPEADRSRLDFTLFLLLPMSVFQIAGLPVPELAMVVAVCVGLTRPSASGRPLPLWFTGLLTLLVTWMIVVALLQGLTPTRRLGHLVVYVLLAVLLAKGRYAMRSVGAGLAAGLVIAGGVGLVGYGPTGFGSTGYEGRLTGLLGDPNLAGFYLLTLGAVAAAHLPRDRRRAFFVVGVGILVLLTLSRTSLLAAGLVGVWIVVGRRVGPLTNVTLLAVLLATVSRLSDVIRNAGPFAERAGSDALRDRIVLLEHVQINSGPWFGNGPGTSAVEVEGAPFFFHNSYLALLNEGGWVAVFLVVAVGGATLLALARLPEERRSLWLEGGVIAVATCAINLGEVLLELPAAVVLGAAIHQVTRGANRSVPKS
jgi:hypothetical protein